MSGQGCKCCFWSSTSYSSSSSGGGCSASTKPAPTVTKSAAWTSPLMNLKRGLPATALRLCREAHGSSLSSTTTYKHTVFRLRLGEEREALSSACVCRARRENAQGPPRRATTYSTSLGSGVSTLKVNRRVASRWSVSGRTVAEWPKDYQAAPHLVVVCLNEAYHHMAPDEARAARDLHCMAGI